MLRGDITVLAKRINCSKTTIYNLCDKAQIDLKPIYGRCNKTVDILSGKTLDQERNEWLDLTIGKINAFKENRAKEKAENKLRKTADTLSKVQTSSNQDNR